jgi:hypothetical protein
MKAQVDALLKALAQSGCAGAEASLPNVLGAIQAPVEDETEIRRALDALRSQRCFVPMSVLATRVIEVANGNHSIYVGRQLAQAKIELNLLDDAVEILNRLMKAVMERGSAKDRSEVSGLLGRTLKQRFVKAAEEGVKAEDDLRAAIRSYGQVFELNPAWHGANLVALVARAERMGVKVETDSAATWARRLLKALNENPEVEWTAWDYASAGEAYLALGDNDKAGDSFAHYWNMTNADPFALAGTERQLREIWQVSLDSSDPFLSSLVLHLEARKLAASGGSVHYQAADLVKLAAQLQAASGQAEATFGAGSAIPLERVLGLLSRAKSICRISNSLNPANAGTGFLVNGRDISPRLQGLFILTNHHVLHGKEASEALLETEGYRGSIDVERARVEFCYWDGGSVPHQVKLNDVVRSSERGKADFALASLAEDIPADRALPLSSKERPLGARNYTDAKQRPKIFVVGHPLGGGLSFSFSDNEVIDHELDDKASVPDFPRRIHYRAPTEKGSSGSPVFHHETLEVVGLHRSGCASPLRENWPRARMDEKYQANEAVSLRSIREFLA